MVFPIASVDSNLSIFLLYPLFPLAIVAWCSQPMQRCPMAEGSSLPANYGRFIARQDVVEANPENRTHGLIRFHSRDLSTFSPRGVWTFGADLIASAFVANR